MTLGDTSAFVKCRMLSVFVFLPLAEPCLEERNKTQCLPSLDTVLGVLPVFTPVSEPVSTALRALGCGHQCQPCSAGSSLKGQRVGTAGEEWGARGSRNRDGSPSEGEGGMWGKGASYGKVEVEEKITHRGALHLPCSSPTQHQQVAHAHLSSRRHLLCQGCPKAVCVRALWGTS